MDVEGTDVEEAYFSFLLQLFNVNAYGLFSQISALVKMAAVLSIVIINVSLYQTDTVM